MSETTEQAGMLPPAPPRDEFMLDLATLHGVERPLIIKAMDGKRYELRRREAMGPADLFILDKVLRRINEIQREMETTEDLSDAQSKRLGDMVQDTLKVLSPDLAMAELCFADQFAILNWYGEQKRQADATTDDATKNADSA